MKKAISFLVALSLLLMTGCSSVDPKWKEQYDLGNTYLTDGNYKDAIASFSQAIEIDDSYGSAYLSRGDAYVLGAQDIAEQPDASLRAIYSYLLHAETDYNNASARDKKLKSTVDEKIDTTERLKRKLVPHKILRFFPANDPNNDIARSASSSFQSTVEVGYSLGKENFENKNFHTVLTQPTELDLTITESFNSLSGADRMKIILSDDTSDSSELTSWLDSHKENYKKITATYTFTTEYKKFAPYNKLQGFYSTIHFGYVDLHTNQAVELTENTSWAINTLEINGQPVDILVIMSGVSADGTIGGTISGTATITMFVPIDYELGTFYIGTNFLDTEQNMTPTFVPFEDIPGTIETHFVSLGN